MRTIEDMLRELNDALAILRDLECHVMPLSGLGEARRRFAKFTAESIIAEVQAAQDAKRVIQRARCGV